MIHVYLLLATGCLLICAALVLVRQIKTAYAVVAAFGVALVAVHASAGWPVSQLPPDGSAVHWVVAQHVWAQPRDATEPRAFTIDDPKLLHDITRQFHGRIDENGDPDVSPMTLMYDRDGGKGVALLQPEQPKWIK